LKIIEEYEGVTFDDVLLVPQYSDLNSRSDVDTSTFISGFKIDIPVISANMDSVTGIEMAEEMWNNGGLGILHRYVDLLNKSDSITFPYIASVGTTELDRDNVFHYLQLKNKPSAICIDIAHGDSIHSLRMINHIRELDENIHIIAGNVATYSGARRLFEVGANTVKAGIGGGCFAGDTRILMGDGTYKDIKDIKVHDKVINMHGNSVEVVATRFSGIKKVVKYKNNIWHKMTTCTPDHKHWIGDLTTTKNLNDVGKKEELQKKTKKGESKYRWAPISECTGKLFPLMPRNINFETIPDFSIDMETLSLSRRNMEGSVELPTITPTYELGYLIGSFLGDGHAKIQTPTRTDGRRNTSGAMYWSYGINEQAIVNLTVDYFVKVFNYKPIVKISEKENMLRVHVRSNPIIRFFEQFGKKHNKHLPRSLFCSNKDYCAGILDGLVDSDGNIDHSRMGLNNSSESLIELYYYVFKNRFGYYPCGQHKKHDPDHPWGNVENWQPSYVVRGLKAPEVNLTDINQISTIYGNVETCEIEMPTYDIEVDCPTHSFIANHAIVHNSICSTRLITGHGVPQITCIAECSRAAREYGGKIISDGGIRYYGDIAKALAAGADAVMSGFLFANCYETESKTHYTGMAAELTQMNNLGKVRNNTPEGVSFPATKNKSTKDVLQQIKGALRSAFSYSGAANLQEFQENATFLRVSSNTSKENGTRKVE
jgi:IMP dehydrogenase/GMP reductase